MTSLSFTLPASKYLRFRMEVATAHGMSVDDLMSRSRRHIHSHARHELMYRLKIETRLSFNSIAKLMGMHHTTVLHGYKRHLSKKDGVNPPHSYIGELPDQKVAA